MSALSVIRKLVALLWLLGLWTVPLTAWCAQTASAGATSSGATVLVIEGPPDAVQIMRAGAVAWDRAYTNLVLMPGDQVRTSANGRATLQYSDQFIDRLGPNTVIVIEPPPAGKPQARASLLQGILYIFHRDKSAATRFKTSTASAAVRGTEFTLEFDGNGRTILTVIDGEVELSNDQGPIDLTSGEQGVAEPGKMPTKTAVINTVNVVQWSLYYPGVLDVDELSFDAGEQQVLKDSLAAYRSGELLAALAKYPANRQPASAADKVYLAALLLSVGHVERTAALLNSVADDAAKAGRAEPTLFLAESVRQLIAAVKAELWKRRRPPELASEWLAESYYQQSQAHLNEALHAARNAVKKSPQFGFGWVRVAELEFSFGRTPEARQALEKGLELSPRNPEALALKGFLLSAQNKISEAIASFDRAIAIDGALGNAWLGRGLCKIRQGHAEAGRGDLLVAAALEPQRALLRSYLGKAYSNEGDSARAGNEIQRAMQLDAKDPTAWLYSALLNQQNNRINEAVRDLETSQDLNSNRRVYRSQLLLDQDRAVRGANLANIYRDAGMVDVSAREATRAVNADYANYSAHLFLANSYNELRDPKQVNLRYETPWLSEYLVANLLAPVGAGTLSQTVSQQEYSKLFERDRFGIASSTEYFSRGDWAQGAVQYGTYENLAYSLEAFYRSDNGQRINNDQEQLTLSLQLKQQITPRDTIYLQSVYYRAEAGDLAQHFDPAKANPQVRTKETQEPLLIAGYHHEWDPGIHTLFLAGRLQDTFEVNNPIQPVLLLRTNGAGAVFSVPLGLRDPSVPTPIAALKYRSEVEIYPFEAQQIWRLPHQTLTAGTRYQFGHFDTFNQLDGSTATRLANNSITSFVSVASSPLAQSFRSDFERISAYGYYHLQVAEPLLLIGGVSYDRLTVPSNFRAPPIQEASETVDKISPKAGLVWTVAKNTVLRGAYTRSLGGVSFDQSFQLEPSQVAGFLQSFRSLIPESVAGSIAAPAFETFGLALDQKFGRATYLGVEADLLKSKASRLVGDYNVSGLGATFPSSTREQLDYREESLLVTLNQLIGDEWSVGARYRLSRAKLQDQFPEIPTDLVAAADATTRAVLNQVDLFALFSHPSGFFAQGDSLWTSQSNRGYSPDRPGDSFWQFNAYAGYRFARRRAELRVGVLNLTDQDYRLDPLNLMTELPRHRTFTASLRFNF